MGLSCSLGIPYFGAVRKFSRPYNNSFIGQAYLIKKADYWPCPFLHIDILIDLDFVSH